MRWQIIQDIELDENKFAFDPKDDVFSISNVLKQCEVHVVDEDAKLTTGRSARAARASLPCSTA